MLDEAIFCYIGSRVENDNILPCEDDVYTAFQRHFEIGGHKTDVIEQQIKAYASVSDLKNIEIQWEGKIA